MAFVYTSERQIKLMNPTISKDIGPGTYSSQENFQKSFHFVPFNSAQERIINQKPKQDPNPGPGHYQSVQDQFPGFLAYREQSSFKSKQQRFKHQISEIPGPGQYKDQKQKLLKKKNAKSQRKNLAELDKNHKKTSSINPAYDLQNNPFDHYFQKTTQKSQSHYSQQEKNVPQRKEVKSVWASDQTKKLASKNIGQTSRDVGPGTYSSDLPQKEYNMSSIFKSNTQRSFGGQKGEIQTQVIFKRLQDKIQIQTIGDSDREKVMSDIFKQYSNIDVLNPGPGQYNYQEKKQLKNSRYQFFGSSQHRFKSPKKFQVKVGPGEYDFQKSVYPRKQQTFYKDNRFLSQDGLMTPGPGFYDPSIGESLRKLRESFMKPHKMPQGRYRLEKIDDTPGPGSYVELTNNQSISKINNLNMTTKENSIMDSSKNLKIYYKKELNNNASKDSIHQQFSLESDEMNINMTQNSISKSLINNNLSKKQKQKVPFLSKQDRFKQTQENTIDIQDETQESTIIQQKSQKQYKKNFLQAERFNYKQDKQQHLGPGEYFSEDRRTLNKKTFNINFIEKV